MRQFLISLENRQGDETIGENYCTKNDRRVISVLHSFVQVTKHMEIE